MYACVVRIYFRTQLVGEGSKNSKVCLMVEYIIQ